MSTFVEWLSTVDITGASADFHWLAVIAMTKALRAATIKKAANTSQRPESGVLSRGAILNW